MPSPIKRAKSLCLSTAVLWLVAGVAHSQPLIDEKLNDHQVGAIEPGTYEAGDSVHFTLDPLGNAFLFHIAGEREVFVLRPEHASLGGRLLKYDSGDTALQVSGWGAMTLYTDTQPQGLAAVRDGDSTAPVPQLISLSDTERAAEDESQHLAYADRINIQFSCDWNALSGDANARALVFDELQNAGEAIDQVVRVDPARTALVHKIAEVKLALANSDAVSLRGRTLVVGVNAAKGYAGRASSREIARTLTKLLSVRQAANP